MTKINLPSIAAIRDGAASFVGSADSVFAIKVCSKSDIAKERSAHLVRNRTPVALRKDGAQWRGSVHQLPACGYSESESVYMNDTALFATTGLFAPNDHKSDCIEAESVYRGNVYLQNAITREMSRRAVVGNFAPFNALSLMSEARKSGTALNLDFTAAAALCGVKSRPSRVLARLSHGDDVMQQLLGDFAIVGAVLVPCLGTPRGKATTYTINAAWRDALASAAAINGALATTEANA